MITPKQFEASHGTRDRRPPRKKHRDTRPAKQKKPDREQRRKTTSDPLFNALRDELGL